MKDGTDLGASQPGTSGHEWPSLPGEPTRGRIICHYLLCGIRDDSTIPFRVTPRIPRAIVVRPGLYRPTVARKIATAELVLLEGADPWQDTW